MHHWTKNVLVFVPLLMSHQIHDSRRVVAAVIVFASFCLASSATYIFNDIIDLPYDRTHRSKRRRPLSAGEMTIPAAGTLMIICALLGLTIAWFLGLETFFIILLYLALTTLYTLVIKRVLMADVVLLAAFYSLRVIAGGAATDIVVSRWLLAFSSFLFMSIALAKRYSDLARAEENNEEPPGGRNYTPSDRHVFLSLGTATGMISVLVFALYLNSSQVATLYRTTDPLWFVCALLIYWIGRMWLMAHRGEIHDDPIVTAVTDPASYVVGMVIAALVIASI